MSDATLSEVLSSNPYAVTENGELIGEGRVTPVAKGAVKPLGKAIIRQSIKARLGSSEVIDLIINDQLPLTMAGETTLSLTAIVICPLMGKSSNSLTALFVDVSKNVYYSNDARHILAAFEICDNWYSYEVEGCVHLEVTNANPVDRIDLNVFVKENK